MSKQEELNMEQVSPTFDLNMHTAKLLLEEPFFAAISRRIDKRASYAIPTAGVMVNPSTAQFEMLYNPDFFASLKQQERLAVLKHEFYHVIFKHVTDRMPDNAPMRHWNLATDLAINSHIEDLPEGGCIPGVEPFQDLPKGKSAEWYLANLPATVKESGNEGDSGQGNSGDNQGDGPSGESPSGGDSEGSNGNSTPKPLDDHSGWQKCPQEIKDIASERIKDIVKKAAEEASQNSTWGSVSSSTRKKIMDSIKTKVDWRKVLRYFVKTSQRANRSSSIKRINRRFPYVHPGRKQARVAKIAISIDQSGSVSDKMLAMFFSELNKVAELAEFTVIPFDTQVDESKIYVWKKGNKKQYERVLCGGTCFNAPTDYVNQRGDFDGHIVLTDMCAPKPKSSKCQRMWMTDEENYRRPYFTTNEKVIAMDRKGE